jgi:amino acid adenylation domain-containing protein
LDARANGLAHRLRDLGVGPDVPVGVFVDRSIDLVVALLAVLKAGGAYVPIDPESPAERLSFMLRDVGARVVLTDARLHDRVPRDIAPVVRVDSIATSDANRAQRLDRITQPANLAYVIYTSGSTGVPKGVAVPHSGAANLIAWHQRVYDIVEDDRATQVANLAFDASVWEIWPYLTAGACVHLAPPAVYRSTANLRTWLAAECITISFLPTPLAELFLAELQQPGPAVALRALLTGGDKLTTAGAGTLPFALVNHYGPTEGSVVTTACHVDETTPLPPPIGRAIDNNRTYVVDTDRRPVPIGVAGALYVGGASLARGYWGRPALTAERFVPDPFAMVPGARMYRTGDRVRWQGDGQLEFLGREDHQVKVSGYRIELGEIEAVLQQHEAVQSAVVVQGAAGPASGRLVAYVMPKEHAPRDAAALRAWLGQHLLEYMQPAAVMFVDAWPLTPNGKIDRTALPPPDLAVSTAVQPDQLPATDVERAIAGVWQEVLGLPAVGRHDNFFDVGGNSLLLLRLCTGLRALGGVDVSIVDLFRHPTVRALALHVTGNRDRTQATQHGQQRAAVRRASVGRRSRTDKTGGVHVGHR